MSLITFCIIPLLITSALGLLIDWTGDAKLDLFITSFSSFGAPGIFCEFSTD